MRTREYRPWHIVDLFYISVCAECIKDRLTSSDSAGELEDTPWACPRAPLGGPPSSTLWHAYLSSCLHIIHTIY